MSTMTNGAQRAVVIGGAGFIGSHLCEALTNTGVAVTCVDNFETGRPGNVEHLAERPTFRLVRSDVLDGVHVDEPVDIVYDLAAPSTPTDYLLDPVRAMRVASTGTVNALELAQAHGARFVLVSTSETYGPPGTEPLEETDTGAVDPVAAYGAYYEARRFAEAVTAAYRTAFAMSTGIARIFNSYGPRMRLDDGRILARLLKQALAGGPITVPGSGAQRRCLCYVDDAVSGVLALAASSHPGPINVGNPDDVSVYSLAQELIDLTGCSSDASFVDSPTHGMLARRPDVSLAGEVLGWRPYTPVKDGLASTVAAFTEAGAARA